MKIELSVVKVYTFFGHLNYAPEYISEFRDFSFFSLSFNTFFSTVYSPFRKSDNGHWNQTHKDRNPTYMT